MRVYFKCLSPSGADGATGNRRRAISRLGDSSECAHSHRDERVMHAPRQRDCRPPATADSMTEGVEPRLAPLEFESLHGALQFTARRADQGTEMSRWSARSRDAATSRGSSRAACVVRGCCCCCTADPSAVQRVPMSRATRPIGGRSAPPWATMVSDPASRSGSTATSSLGDRTSARSTRPRDPGTKFRPCSNGSRECRPARDVPDASSTIGNLARPSISPGPVDVRARPGPL